MSPERGPDVLIVDDIMFFPVRSILWIVREVHQAAQQEIVGEAESITAELRDLYMMLETGKISEDEYDAREQALLARLEKLRHEGDAS